ncbi:hypothetical protein HanIR_Chr13g0654361 [Helianthus annuus]|nr:hypothetical protein HanIR_Chr13g0654361 [Helianthus annuus]
MHHARNRALMCTRSRAYAHDCHVMRQHATLPTTWSLQPLCFHHAHAVKNTKAALKRLAAMRACEVRHQSATLRLIAHVTRARVRVRVPFASALASAPMKQ